MKMQVVTITRWIDNIGEHVTISSEKDNNFKTLCAVFTSFYSNGFFGCSYRQDGSYIESVHTQTFDEFVKEVFTK